MDPPIEAFIPTKIFTEDTKVEVKDLSDLIRDAEVHDALYVYQLLQKSNTEIPPELKQSFFELICFYNCDEPLDVELVEERWFQQSVKAKERMRKTWKDHDLAEQMFAEIEEQDSKQFSTIIRGMCKFYQAEKAWAFYNDALSKNVPLDVEVFNSILNITTLLKESAEMRWAMIVETLKTMKDKKVDPNLGTMNACLGTIALMGGRTVREYALAILSEFKQIGVEPSLASWYFVLHTFCKERGPVSHVLIDILNQIEGKEFHIRDIRDTAFFTYAMEICRYHLHDKALAKRVNALLHVGDNYNLIGDSYKESIYYRNYFSLLVSTEPLEVFMETYHDLVPNVYIPEPSVMEDILKTVEVSGAIEHMPMLWSHIIMFDHNTRESILEILTRIMIQNPPTPTFPQHEHLNEKFGFIAYDMWMKIEERNESRTKPIVWTGKLLGDIITILCRVEEFEKAAEIFTKLADNQDKILGEPFVGSMQNFIELCINQKQPSKSIHCLQYCYEMGFPEARELAKSIVKGFTLDEHHSKKIAVLAGIDVLQEATDEKLKATETP